MHKAQSTLNNRLSNWTCQERSTSIKGGSKSSSKVVAQNPSKVISSLLQPKSPSWKQSLMTKMEILQKKSILIFEDAYSVELQLYD